MKPVRLSPALLLACIFVLFWPVQLLLPTLAACADPQTDKLESIQRSAEQGNPESQYLLGRMYLLGQDIEQSDELGCTWSLAAAEQGQAQAQNNVGHCYMAGKYFAQDFVKAAYWFEKSADQRGKHGQFNLGKLYLTGKGVNKDQEKALLLLHAAAEQGHALAQQVLGLIYLKGDGGVKDHAASFQWYLKAAEQGDLPSQHQVGSSYTTGRGVTQDYTKAVYWLRKAAENGFAASQTSLGRMYLEGKGIGVDREIAKQWFAKAASQGEQRALQQLEKLARLDDVFLELEKTGHSGRVNDLLFSSDGGLLVSASLDKTVDVWDVATGKNILTVYGEIGPGSAGAVDTIALSPNNALLATAGSFPGSKGTVRLYDLKTGELLKTLNGHTDAVSDLTFSSDGRILLSSSIDNTARIWDMTTHELISTFTHDSYVLHGLFLHGNDVVVTGAGNDLYWWDVQKGERLRKIQAHEDQIFALILLPDGNISSSGADSMVREWESSTGNKRFEFKAGLPLRDMDLAANGNVLFWSRPDRFGTIPLKKSIPEFFLDRQPELRYISASAIAPDGQTGAVGHADGTISLVDVQQKKIIKELSGRVSKIKKVAFSQDGRQLIWQQKDRLYGLQIRSNKAYRVGAVVQELPEQTSEADRITEAAGWSISVVKKNKDVLEVRYRGKKAHTIKASGGMRRFRDAQLIPDGRIVLSHNGGRIISAYRTSDGKRLWKRPFSGATASIADIAVSPDSRLLAVGEADQTIKLYSIATGELLITLFYDGNREWIAWNPDGYYTGSLGGDQLISWHLNQGTETAGSRFPARQFSKQYYAPEIVASTLSAGDMALTQQKGMTQYSSSPKPLQQLLPPRVSLLLPDRKTLSVSDNTIRIRARAVSNSIVPITDIWILVNGRRADAAKRISATKTNFKKINDLVAEIDLTVELPKTLNYISLIASNRFSQSEPLIVEVTKKGGFPTDEETTTRSERKKSDLYILSVGVSDYQQKDISLDFAHNDAQGVAGAFSEQTGRLYNEVHKQVLLNSEATRDNILDGLDWLLNNVTPDDITILFIAGHGQKDQRGNYYFLPHDVDIQGLRRSGVKWDEFNDILYSLPSKVILMADTCHSGSITGKTLGSDISHVLRQITRSEGGIVVLTASTGDEVSVERPDWGHGAFSMAVIEGLQGKADYTGDDVIGMKELDLYINTRVKELTRGRQHATTEIPRVLPDFDLLAL